MDNLLAENIRLKQALRSCMNELLKDSMSPEVKDYFDYVKALRAEIKRLHKEANINMREICRLRAEIQKNEGENADKNA